MTEEVFTIGTVAFRATFDDLDVRLLIIGRHYADGGLAVLAQKADTGEPFATLSANFPEAGPLKEGHFFLKTWSENAELADVLVRVGFFEPVEDGLTVHSGYVEAHEYRVIG